MNVIKASNWAVAPVDLLTGSLSMKARICYVAMRSFGPESRASLSAIAFRMGIGSESTAREAQKELVQAGWISLLEEGKAGGKGNEGMPRVWQINDKTIRVQDSLTLKPNSILINNTRNIEGNQAEKEIQNQAENLAPKKPGRKHQDQDLFWAEAKLAWEKAKGCTLAWPSQTGFQDRLTKAITTYGWQELARRFSNYLSNTWMTSQSLSHFLTDPDRYTQAPQKGAQSGAVKQRGFNQAQTSWRSSDPQP